MCIYIYIYVYKCVYKCDMMNKSWPHYNWLMCKFNFSMMYINVYIYIYIYIYKYIYLYTYISPWCLMCLLSVWFCVCKCKESVHSGHPKQLVRGQTRRQTSQAFSEEEKTEETQGRIHFNSRKLKDTYYCCSNVCEGTLGFDSHSHGFICILYT